MSDFAPELREAYLNALRERRDLTAGLPYADCWETAARLLELDGAGVIDLDVEPGLRAYVAARLDRLDVPTEAYLKALDELTSKTAWASLIAGGDADDAPARPSPSHARRH